MQTVKTALSRAATRFGLALAATGVALAAVPAPADAHVEIRPAQVEGGGTAKVAFGVPNERDNASTTRLRVILPQDQPITAAQATPMRGWRARVDTRKLADPIQVNGTEIDTVVSHVTWTATSGGIRPGRFVDFRLRLGELPKSGDLAFTVLQTYSSGEVARWNEVSADGKAELEHPAPVLSVTAPPAADGAESSPSPEQGSEAPDAVQSDATDTAAETDTASSQDPATDASSTSSTVVLVVAVGAATLAVAGALAWRRRRG